MQSQAPKIAIGLYRAVNHIERHTAKIYAKYGLTIGQFAVLEALYHKGDLTVGQVQEKILSSSGTIPVITRHLEERGFIEKLSDPNDKRKNILHLTSKGLDLIKKVYPENEKELIKLMQCWSLEEQKLLQALLKKYGDDIR